MDTTRSGPLEDLVHWRGETAALVQAIRQSKAKGPVMFDRSHAAAAATTVATGLARPDELVDWAHAVHFEDELEIEDGHEDLLTRFLFEVSTPELFEPISVRVCQRWLHIMRASLALEAEAAGR
ncbi:hypothetical protein HUT19_38935 [Streptomyces sp. NA02950]|uniref:hypothetical protein n=1 Tax=Streptomyces sp. NA02950 TaxID=2742137 RepID=UPI001591530D|nr:hypothetical protein [Streptomyces sp. NA02950]QKV90362.1 hypothetical protein HUT19_38935 [Streptomyces sp. NA02950]